jgi:hypothetical protein
MLYDRLLGTVNFKNMKAILILILLIVTVICWIFSTSLVVNGENTPLAFKIKSVLYWVAIILSFAVGFYCA